MKNFYVATALERAEEQRMLTRELEALGFTNAYDWTQHGSVQNGGTERIKKVAVAESSAVISCDLFVAMLPGGRGTHTEIGLALASSMERHGHNAGNKTILLVGPTEDAFGRTCSFYLHPQVNERFATVDELLEWLKSWRRL